MSVSEADGSDLFWQVSTNTESGRTREISEGWAAISQCGLTRGALTRSLLGRAYPRTLLGRSRRPCGARRRGRHAHDNRGHTVRASHGGVMHRVRFVLVPSILSFTDPIGEIEALNRTSHAGTSIFRRGAYVHRLGRVAGACGLSNLDIKYLMTNELTR